MNQLTLKSYLDGKIIFPKSAYPTEHVIYFLEAPEVNRVKIGYARQLHIRLVSYATHSPVKLRLMGTHRGNPQMEHQLHALFWRARVHGEWFELSAELRCAISELVSCTNGDCKHATDIMIHKFVPKVIVSNGNDFQSNISSSNLTPQMD